jgi:hypothetical protein
VYTPEIAVDMLSTTDLQTTRWRIHFQLLLEPSARLFGAAWEKGTQNRVSLEYGRISRRAAASAVKHAGVQREAA